MNDNNSGKLIEEASNFDILIEKKFLLNMVQRFFNIYLIELLLVKISI